MRAEPKMVTQGPIILVGSSYWKGLIDWIKDTMLEVERNINPEDLDLFSIVDDADTAVKVINDFYSRYTLQPNF